VLSARGLTLWRGDLCLFEDLSFHLAAGQALVLRGPNGSGKTTLLRVIAGLTTPESGDVLWGGETLGRVSRRQLLLAYCGHLPGLKGDLTVAENLSFYARLHGCPPARLATTLERLGLAGLADLEMRLLSAGQKRRAALARVLLTRVPLWLLDEPQTNLDSAARRTVEEAIQEHLAGGGVAVIASHQPLDAGSGSVVELELGEAA
jgi:heme exporter protein A